MSEETEEKTSKKLGVLARKAAKASIKTSVKVGKFVKETIDEVSKEDTKVAIQKNKNMQEQKKSVQKQSIFNQKSTGINKIDDQINIWRGWFYSTVTYLLIIIITFMISSFDSRFTILAWILAIGFPFFLLKAIVNSIPEIKIGNKTIFSRKDISYRDQLTFTSTIFRMFSREVLENHPYLAGILGLFILILIYVIIAPFF